jgi:hypothetical protein
MALDRPDPLNSLGFAKPPADTRVVVAMSGGVDSSVVAAMLAEEGYDVVGVTLQLYDHGAALAKKGACCAGRDIHDARRVAEEMGFPHYVLDYENTFREAVIDEFADSYLAGATPVPCIRCNERVKFRTCWKRRATSTPTAWRRAITSSARWAPRRRRAPRAADAARDQSYFLFSTTQEQLDFLRFPLGHLASKAETRALAAKYGLSVADKPDSQDICFVPNGDYAAVIEKLRPGAADPGEIVDMDGNILGEHRGVIHLHDRPAPRPRHRRARRSALRGEARPRRAPRDRRPEGGALDPPRPGARDQLARRRAPSTAAGVAGGGQDPLHPPAARRDPPPALADGGGGRPHRGRGRRQPRAGLRLLRPQRHRVLGGGWIHRG